MERAINGRNIAREYYSLSNNQLRLVRLEDDKGNVIHNAYTLPTYTIGVVPAAKTIREFTQMLDSADKAEVLEALGFLGARHFDDFPGSTEHSEHAQFVQVLTESQQIRAIILHLAKSPHPWIREAGALATRPLKARPIF